MELRIALFEDEDRAGLLPDERRWIARSLEFELFGVGSTMREALINFSHAYASGLPNACDRTGQEAVGNCGCFLPGTLVSASGVSKAYRRWYEGEVVRVVTAASDFTVTPNHPILRVMLSVDDLCPCSSGSRTIQRSWCPPRQKGCPAGEASGSRLLSCSG